jgi:GT2 family glycosyltransferase
VSKSPKVTDAKQTQRNVLASISRIRINHSEDVGGQVSLSDAIGHYFALIRELGLWSGTKTMVVSGVQFLKEGKGSFSLRRLKRDRTRYPVLNGAPREWEKTISYLCSHVSNFQKQGFNPDKIPEIIENLGALIAHSGNEAKSASVTIVIPAYNNFVEVAVLIESIASFASSSHYSIIIADDASPDFNFSAFGVLPGVRVMRNATNCGYINNVNHAATGISTTYLLTLNQDIVVCPGWLDEMVAEMERDPRNAIVGPRVLDHDFTIREAGALIFQEAHAMHRGRGSIPDVPRFAYSRNVDYVSGCALLIRTAVWDRLGGLDEQYKPAYYDDVDLCLRVHDLGLRVRYAPLSCVIHFEGTSMGKDVANQNSLKSYQLINRAKIAAVHRDVLSTHTKIHNKTQLDSHFSNGTKVVCVFDTMPHANRDGGSVDFELIVQYLISLDFQVAALFNRRVSPQDSLSWRANGVLCEELGSTYGKQLVAEANIIFSFGTMVGIRLAKENLSGKRWIHHTSDIATRRLQAMNELFKDQQHVSAEASRWFLGMPRDEKQMWAIEKPTLENPSTTLFVTAHDLQYAQDNEAVGNFVHFPILKGGPDTNDIPAPLAQMTVGFVGSFLHSPNSDAVEYFLRDLWPSIYKQVPTSRFLIWGSGIKPNQSADWSALPGVEIRGWFATWEEVVAQTRVLVSPLRFGAGMKHKVVSTLIYGRPVVGTCTSFEGFEIGQLSKKVMTDDPHLLIKSTVEILQSDDACNQALREGLSGMGSQFSRSNEIERLRMLITDTLASEPINQSKVAN